MRRVIARSSEILLAGNIRDADISKRQIYLRGGDIRETWITVRLKYQGGVDVREAKRS